jgi:hypothetical protein
MVSMLDELKERNILKLILIVRFACATLDVGHPIYATPMPCPDQHFHDICQQDREDCQCPADQIPFQYQSFSLVQRGSVIYSRVNSYYWSASSGEHNIRLFSDEASSPAMIC